jgi:NAD-dependent SIR2 family protein deacetylase
LTGSDLARGRCLPFIGAGFSLNAVLPKGSKMPTWDELGRAVAASLSSYEYANGLDALSAFAHEYSRSKLIEKLFTELHTHDAQPGAAHRAFCKLPFDIVCTTNFDTLLEHAYREQGQFCRAIISEDQLGLESSVPAIRLVKIHGDLDHPARVVVTEEDYDGFLERNPLMATHVANLLISKTPVFIGYSLDDADLRSIWQLIKDRLGRLRHPAYAIRVNESSHVISRFDRRGVRVINLPGAPKDYGKILAQAFEELAEFIRENALKTSTVTKDEPLAELSMPKSAPSRLCFFSYPRATASFYRSFVFPIAVQCGLAPVTAEDVVTPGDSVLAKTSALLDRSEFVVLDVGTDGTSAVTSEALRGAREGKKRLLVIREADAPVPVSLEEFTVIRRSRDLFEDAEHLQDQIEAWLAANAASIKQSLEDEPRRLLEKGENRAAVIAAFTLLEVMFKESAYSTRPRVISTVPAVASTATATTYSLQEVLDLWSKESPNASVSFDEVRRWRMVRNRAVHSNEHVTASAAKKIVDGVYRIIGFARSRHLADVA